MVAVSMQPGAILTGITKEAFRRFSEDTFELAGGTAVVCLFLLEPFLPQLFYAGYSLEKY